MSELRLVLSGLALRAPCAACGKHHKRIVWQLECGHFVHGDDVVRHMQAGTCPHCRTSSGPDDWAEIEAVRETIREELKPRGAVWPKGAWGT